MFCNFSWGIYECSYFVRKHQSCNIGCHFIFARKHKDIEQNDLPATYNINFLKRKTKCKTVLQSAEQPGWAGR
jgi:hypothetical protein